MKQHVLEALAAKSVGDLSPVFTAQKGRAGCSPWEFAFGAGRGKVWLLAVAWLLFTWLWVGDVGSDTSVFVPGAATSQQCLAALSWRRKIYIKQKAVKGCVFIDRRQS